MLRSIAALVFAGLALVFLTAAQQTSGSIEIRMPGGGLRTITPDWQKINAQPLGSRGNPIRVDGIAGERAYLERLVCGNGALIAELRRIGATSVGPYTTAVATWEAECYGELYVVYLDPHHPGYVENRPPRGFAIRDP